MNNKLRQLPNDVIRGYGRKRKRRRVGQLRTANGSAGLLRVMACDSSVCGFSGSVPCRAVLHSAGRGKRQRRHLIEDKENHSRCVRLTIR
jgi:hypothetical protein